MDRSGRVRTDKKDTRFDKESVWSLFPEYHKKTVRGGT